MLKTLIVDDEAPARKRLRKLLQPFEEANRLHLEAEARDGVEALEAIEAGNFDLVFLDIRMPGHDGFEVLDRISPANRPHIIFTTAYDEYAIRAFEANAVDYLLKPLAKERLEAALGKAERMQKNPETASQDERFGKLLDWLDAQSLTPSTPPPPQEYIRQLSIPYRDRILIVQIHRLISVEIVEGITRVYVMEDSQIGPKPNLRQHIVNYTLEQLEEHLDPSAFMRVHRSVIVQLSSIQEMIPWFSGRYKLMLTGGHEVIASRERSKLLKERLMI